MKANCFGSIRISRRVGLALALCSLAVLSGRACTIFTLVDTNGVLFCNNEDWNEPKTRIWFVPGGRFLGLGARRYGCAYVGFANQVGQGGLNTEGLAYDWVAGYQAKWERDPKLKLKTARGFAWERMLETCATVPEAVAFFQTHWVHDFSYSKIMVADRSGASVIIGATNGVLDIQIQQLSRGFGYGGEMVTRMLAAHGAPSLTNAAAILRSAMQAGKHPTQYSNVFDLKTGEIFLFRFPEQPEPVRLSLAEELKRGRHSYELPTIRKKPSSGSQ